MGENGPLDEAGFLESLTQINSGRRVEPEAGSRRPLSELFPPTAFQRPPDPLRGVATGPAVRARARVDAEPQHPNDAAGYETFYGFHDRPFGPVPDLRFLYHSAAYDAASEALLTAISRRDAITVLTGSLGVGKTLLCGAVIDQLDRRTMTSVIRDPLITLDDLLERVLVDFGVMSHEESSATGGRHDALTAALQSFSASLAPLQAAAVIVIDDAHRLATEVIDHLDILMSGGGGALVLILVGEPGLLKMLKRPALRALDERIGQRVALGPLAGDEVPGYILHRLRSAGDATRADFDDDAISAILALSGGVPAVVNRVCDRALMRGFESSVGVINAGLVEQAARDLNLASRHDARALASVAVTLSMYLLLMLLGASAAAWLFWDRVVDILRRWHLASW